MEISWTVICLFAIFWSSKGEDVQTNLQRHSLYQVFPNRTSILFQNVNAIFGNGILNKNKDRNDYLDSANEIMSSRIQSLLPPFALTSDNINNLKCKEDSQKFLKNLNEMNLWALKMHDSSGKLPSGLLNGNVNQFGDFDECISIDESNHDIRGKYCLAYIQIKAKENEFHSSKIFKIYEMLQSHFAFRSTLNDPGHRVPRFSTLNWGLCVPNSCTSHDVEIKLQGIVQRFSNGTGFEVEVRVDNEMCQEKKIFKVTTSIFIVSCLFFLVVTVAGLATLVDVFICKEYNDTTTSIWSLLRCFSLKRNGKTLLSLERSSDDIKPVHGIRMVNALMLVFCHKSMALFFMPYSNRTTMVEKLSAPWSIIARMASLYTDSFVMISGLLTSYSITKNIKRTGNLNLKSEYLNRLIRIVPPLVAIILLCTFILPELGSGPQWNLTVTHHAEKCKETWWRNLLFIHNYFGFENMCLTHTHHMGIDTQLFFLSPFLIYSLIKWPMFGVVIAAGGATLSTWARYHVTASKNLSFFIYPGISVHQMFNTANYSYIIPFHRLTSYIIGIFFGFALRHYDKHYRIKSSYLRLGWTITFSFLSYILTKASEMNYPGYVYNNKEAAIYAALAPIAWSLLVGWMIFVSQMGCGGFIGRVASSKYFLIWTRLSYSVYLTQFPIFFFNIGLQKYPQQYSIFLLVNVLENIGILAASSALTLLFEMPFSNIRKLIISR